MDNFTRVFPDLLRTRDVRSRVAALEGERAGSFGLVRGRTQVSAMARFLSELGRRTGQAGALDLVPLLVRTPSALRKTPCLVLVGLRPGVAPEQAGADDVDGAVLLYEYRVAGAGTGVFATDDIHGERTVLAPPDRRHAIAESACRMLIADGAVACLVSFEGGRGTGAGTESACYKGARCDIAVRTRTKERDLVLRPSLDETLATLGPSTRRNLRRYRSRAAQELGVRCIPDVQIEPEEFLKLDLASTNPAGRDVTAWRYHFAYAQPRRLLVGLRGADGQWLSLVGGCRQGDAAVLEWQMNHAGLPRYSLSTVLRSFLLELEIARGTRVLRFMGGTPHSISHWLQPAAITDVVALRCGVRGETLRWLSHLLPESNFLGRTLSDATLDWKHIGRAA